MLGDGFWFPNKGSNLGFVGVSPKMALCFEKNGGFVKYIEILQFNTIHYRTVYHYV